MTLTVPTGGTAFGQASRPGRAAKPGPVAPDDTGAALAGLGQSMLDVGTRIEADRLDRHMERASLDLAREFGALRAQVDSAADPDIAAQLWDDGVLSLRQGFEQPDDDGRARLDPANAERFGLAFDNLVVRHELSLGPRLFNARQAQQFALEAETSREALDLFARSDDPQMQAAAIDLIDGQLERAIEAGRIRPEQAAALRTAWLGEADTTRVLLEVDGDDADLLAEPDPTPADSVAAAIAADPDVARLARITGYSPDSAEAVTDMQARIEQFEALEPASRAEHLTGLQEASGAERRRNLKRPRFFRGAGMTYDELRDTADRMVAAFRSGQIDRVTYAREAKNLRMLMETYDDR
ncbi:MAG: hypothetical protein AAF408_00085 [Pseudomonadota bacterium]